MRKRSSVIAVLVAAISLMATTTVYATSGSSAAKSKKTTKPASTGLVGGLSPADYIDIMQLYGFYARDVDPGSVRNPSWMFTPDGTFRAYSPTLTAPLVVTGKAALHTFYEGIRSTQSHGIRHINATFVIVGTKTGARASGYMLQVQNKTAGPPGQLPQTTIDGVGKYEDTLVKTLMGWRFKERIFTFDTFRADTIPVSPSPTAGPTN